VLPGEILIYIGRFNIKEISGNIILATYYKRAACSNQLMQDIREKEISGRPEIKENY